MFFRRNPKVSEETIKEFERRRILEQARKGMQKERREKVKRGFRTVGREIRGTLPTQKEFREARFRIGERVREFARAGLRREEPFTQEQMALKSMFGGGEKIWGWKNEPVEINNDLHPSISDRGDETASLFGFGRR